MAENKNNDKKQNQIYKLEEQLSELKLQFEETKVLLKEEQNKRKFYQLIADFTFGWELWFEPNGIIKYCSPSCFDLTGYSSNQIILSNNISELLVYEIDRNKFNEFIIDSLKQVGVNQTLEFRILTRTKQLRWCLINARGVYDRFGKYLGVRASIQDITKLKRAMGSIRELESGNEFQQKTKQRLKSELDLKDRELVSILLQLSQKNEIISTINNLSTSGQKAGSSKQILEKINQITQTKNLQKLDWSIIENQIEKLHPGFFNHLLIKHPLLTNNEKKLCCYLRLGLSSKDISGLQNISAKSVEISRVRLRKKLKINSKLRLTNYLSQI